MGVAQSAVAVQKDNTLTASATAAVVARDFQRDRATESRMLDGLTVAERVVGIVALLVVVGGYGLVVAVDNAAQFDGDDNEVGE